MIYVSVCVCVSTVYEGCDLTQRELQDYAAGWHFEKAVLIE